MNSRNYRDCKLRVQDETSLGFGELSGSMGFTRADESVPIREDETETCKERRKLFPRGLGELKRKRGYGGEAEVGSSGIHGGHDRTTTHRTQGAPRNTSTEDLSPQHQRV